LGIGAPHWAQFSLQVCSAPQYWHLTITVSGGGGGGNEVASDSGLCTVFRPNRPRDAETAMATMRITKNSKPTENVSTPVAWVSTCVST